MRCVKLKTMQPKSAAMLLQSKYMPQFIKLFSSGALMRVFGMLLAVSLSMISISSVQAAESNTTGESVQILQEFNTQHREAEHAKSITDKDKKQVMFILGVLLLVMVMITGGLGIAMGIYGKPVFLAHMVFAGLSMTLAIVHAIAGIVWFFPY